MRFTSPFPFSVPVTTAFCRRWSVVLGASVFLLSGLPNFAYGAKINSFRDEPVNGLFTDDHGKYHFTGDFTANVSPEVAP